MVNPILVIVACEMLVAVYQNHSSTQPTSSILLVSIVSTSGKLRRRSLPIESSHSQVQDRSILDRIQFEYETVVGGEIR